MFYNIAKTLSVTASITGILMMAGACSVKSRSCFTYMQHLESQHLLPEHLHWNISGYGNGSTGKGK